MKKLLNLVLCGLLILSITGCGNDNNNNDDKVSNEQKKLTQEEKYDKALEYLNNVVYYQYDMTKTYTSTNPTYISVRESDISVIKENKIVSDKTTTFKYTNDGINYNETEIKNYSPKHTTYYDYENNRIIEYDQDCEKLWAYNVFSNPNNVTTNGRYIPLILNTSSKDIKNIDENTYHLEINSDIARKGLSESIYLDNEIPNGMVKIDVLLDENKISNVKIKYTSYTNSTVEVDINFKNYSEDDGPNIKLPTNLPIHVKNGEIVNAKTCNIS